MTLRARLTLWYAAVLAGVLVLFGAAVYFMLSVSMTRQIEQSLDRTADDILRASQRSLGGPTYLPPLDLTANVYVEAFDANGSLVDMSANLTAFDQAFDSSQLSTQVRTFSSVEVGGVHFRVLTVPIVVPPGQTIIGYLQLASSMATVVQARDMLLLLLIVGGALAVLAAALVGGATARAALHPLNQVTETALQITRADDLSRRIPQSSHGNDEVGRLVQAFNESLERLENLFETQRRFLADVSHELRTPLTSIRGNVDLIRRMGEPDPESLDAITSEVDRMTRMVQDLLLLAQAETGKLPMARAVVELDTLMLEVYQQAKMLAQDRVEVLLGREDQARVLGDRDRLKQVLLNLVGNALEYTPPGGRVTLALSCVEDWARLTVTDTGPGIPQEELPHIFERFYRIDRSRRRTTTGGAGLGLSIAYWITRSHQGRLEVASDVGKGSTFSIWLPLHREASLPSGVERVPQLSDKVES
jgi:two-component system OmpR family sensor kinase